MICVELWEVIVNLVVGAAWELGNVVDRREAASSSNWDGRVEEVFDSIFGVSVAIEGEKEKVFEQADEVFLYK